MILQTNVGDKALNILEFVQPNILNFMRLFRYLDELTLSYEHLDNSGATRCRNLSNFVAGLTCKWSFSSDAVFQGSIPNY